MSRNKREGFYLGKTSKLYEFPERKHVRNNAKIGVYGHSLTKVASVNATIVNVKRCLP